MHSERWIGIPRPQPHALSRPPEIPLIFTSLPVILILGLAFFLVGLIVFLFELSWSVAIPVAIAIAFTFVFLLTTTLHPALQSFRGARPSDNPDCVSSPYRSTDSPQSLLFLRPRDWTERSQNWLRQRQADFAAFKTRQLSHLESRPEVFDYDTIKALVSVIRSAESEKERTVLAAAIHLDILATRDLADLIPLLPSSEFVPSALFSRKNSATREDLRDGSRENLLPAVRTHIFDSVPNSKPLLLISKPGTSHLLPWHRGFS